MDIVWSRVRLVCVDRRGEALHARNPYQRRKRRPKAEPSAAISSTAKLYHAATKPAPSFTQATV